LKCDWLSWPLISSTLASSTPMMNWIFICVYCTASTEQTGIRRRKWLGCCFPAFILTVYKFFEQYQNRYFHNFDARDNHMDWRKPDAELPSRLWVMFWSLPDTYISLKPATEPEECPCLCQATTLFWL
jgi:hypothetical protein